VITSVKTTEIEIKEELLDDAAAAAAAADPFAFVKQEPF
jgi:hypothetical protein